MRRFEWGLFALAWVVVFPVGAHAQSGASITGVVKDASGAVLPGVTVEVSSPALIEKGRSAVTDGGGQYRITELPPGTYAATFTLEGFSMLKREGLELTGSFTLTLSVELTIGSVTETVVVTGATPTLDLQSPTRQAVVDHAVIDALPTGRNMLNLSVLIPGITLAFGLGNQDVGNANGPTFMMLAIHGSHDSDQRVTLNGVSLSAMVAGGAGSTTFPDAAAVAEIRLDTSAVSAELATAGPRINVISRDGGNRFAGTVFGSFANDSMQASNFTDRVKALGFTTPGGIVKNVDVNPGFGGPLLKDRLWFYLAGRRQVADILAPGVFYNKNANKLDEWAYLPEVGRPVIQYRVVNDVNGRLTWQAAAKHKVGFLYNMQTDCTCPIQQGTAAPEAFTDNRFPLQRPIEVDWTSPISGKLLLEASAIHRVQRWGPMPLQSHGNDVDPRMVSVMDIGPGAYRPGMTYRSAPGYSNNLDTTFHWVFKASYVTGAHALKVGINDAWGRSDGETYARIPYSYVFFTQVGAAPTPFSVIEAAAPFTTSIGANRDLGLFAQDKWTFGRATLSLGVRYDHFRSSFPRQTLEPSPLTPDRHLVFEETPFLNWHDVTPKSGLSYDLFGNGKTAVKVSLNKYLRGYGTTLSVLPEPNPVFAAVGLASTTRIWDDAFFGPGDPRTGNYVPDCDLSTRTPGANGECGALNDPLFGSNDVQALLDRVTYDPHLAAGWGKRDYNWEFAVGVQHQLLPRVSVDVSFFRRWYGNFHVLDNLALSASDFNRFTYTTPVDPRLPGGGEYTVAGFPVVKPDVGSFGFVTDRNVVKLSDDVGRQLEHWNGVDLTVNARLRHGFLAQGGVSTGRTSTDNCDIVAKQPEGAFEQFDGFRSPFFLSTLPDQFCKRDGVFITQVKAFAAYTIPRIDVLVSGTFQSLPGLPILANANLGSGDPFATVIGGVPVTGVQAFIPQFQIAEPGKFYGGRLNQLDVRVGKVFKVGRTRANVNVDVYNLFNVDTITGQDPTYTPVPDGQPIWKVPTQILPARFFKITAQFDF